MADRPNVLVIMSDQHHAGILGCAGDPVIQTPNLDRLAASGVRLHNTYCPFPLCGPSRSAFMTSRYCHDIEVWTNNRQLSSDTPTFAHAFTAANYTTALSGRMHFVGPDQHHGFLKRPIADVAGTAHIEASWKLDEVLGCFINTPGSNVSGIHNSGRGYSGYQTYDRQVCEVTSEWLKHYASGDREQPFMLVTGLVLPHCPFVAPPEEFDYYAERISQDDLPPPDELLHPRNQEYARQTKVEPPPPRDAQWRTRVAYYGMVAYMDKLIGNVLETLTDTGLADNTIVVYTSDHGEMLGEHGLWWKSNFYDGASRVPLIISAPGRLPKGQTVTGNCNLIDIGPTLLDLAGLPPLPNVSGRSLLPLLTGAGDWDNTTFIEHTNTGSATQDVIPERSVRHGDWKYNYYHGLPAELYNLAEDPTERHNRIHDPDCAVLAEELRARVLQDWDPEFVIKRLRRNHEEMRLVADWLRRVDPPEPVPIWYNQPPRNELV